MLLLNTLILLSLLVTSMSPFGAVGGVDSEAERAGVEEDRKAEVDGGAVEARSEDGV